MQGLFKYLVVGLWVAACSSSRNGLPLFTKENPFNAPANIDVVEWAKTHDQTPFTLVFSGNVNGELGTCGCAVNPKGGLDRRFNALNEIKSKARGPLLLVDAGNALFSSKNFDPAHESEQKQKAALLLRAHKLLGIVAQNVGSTDLAAGVNFLKNAANANNLLLVSTNLVDVHGQPVFKKSYVVKLSPQLDVAILGLLSSDTKVPSGFKVEEAAHSLNKELENVPPSLPVVILSDLGLAEDRVIAANASRPLIIVGGRELSSLEIPVQLNKSIIVQAQMQGQQWGLVEMAYNANGEDGFYNSKLGDRFARRWSELKGEQSQVERMPSSDDKEFELDKLASMAEDMKRYLPGDLNKRSVYDYSLVDLTEAFKGHNVMTSIMNEGKAH
jgi:2',3'-cyclic-nucleotide 2'-phosphodiesterase (5'-nucleotidase family)